jgi:hypothetical protein
LAGKVRRAQFYSTIVFILPSNSFYHCPEVAAACFRFFFVGFQSNPGRKNRAHWFRGVRILHGFWSHGHWVQAKPSRHRQQEVAMGREIFIFRKNERWRVPIPGNPMVFPMRARDLTAGLRRWGVI